MEINRWMAERSSERRWEQMIASSSTLVQAYDTRAQLLQSYMTIDGFRDYLEDISAELVVADEEDARTLRRLRDWAMEGLLRMEGR